MRRWMARSAARLLVLFWRLTVFVPAPEGGCLPRRLTFQLLDAFLQGLDEFAQLLVILLERLVFRNKPCLFDLEFLDTLVARVGFHAILPSPRLYAMTLEVCTMKPPSANQ